MRAELATAPPQQTQKKKVKTELLSNFQSLDYAACFFFIISIHEAIVRKKASIRVYSKNTTLRVSNNRKTIFMFTALSRVSYECDELKKKGWYFAQSLADWRFQCHHHQGSRLKRDN